MGGASPLLSTPRGLAFIALAAGLTTWYYVVDSLPALSNWWDVGLLACVLMPAVFSFDLIVLPPHALALLPSHSPWARWRCWQRLRSRGARELRQLAAVTFFAFWLLGFFEELVLLVIVAVIIPWVDAYSVFRGPTGHIVAKHPHVFTNLSFAFPLPDGQTARLGLPDLLFFALFLAAAYRFGLRVGWTWFGMVALLGVTVALAQWTELNGLPALPAISLGFLLPNVDLLWVKARRWPRLS